MMEREIRKAVITGPTGAIGTALADLLASEGMDVYAVIRPNSGRADSLPVSERIHRIPCNISNYEKLPDMVPEGADAFFHFAWVNTIGPGRNDMKSQIDNIRYSIDAANAASKMGCRIFIGAGSQAEYGRVEGMLRSDTPCFPESGYGMAKLCAGQMTRAECEKLGIDHIWIRVLSVYGPHDAPTTMVSSVISKLQKGEKPALTKGEQKWDYLYSKDAARAFYLAAKRGIAGKVYPLGSGEAGQIKDYVEIIRDIIDPNLPLNFGEVPYAKNQVMFLQADISDLCRDTGFATGWAFEDGIKDMLKATV